MIFSDSKALLCRPYMHQISWRVRDFFSYHIWPISQSYDVKYLHQYHTHVISCLHQHHNICVHDEGIVRYLSLRRPTAELTSLTEVPAMGVPGCYCLVSSSLFSPTSDCAITDHQWVWGRWGFISWALGGILCVQGLSRWRLRRGSSFLTAFILVCTNESCFVLVAMTGYRVLLVHGSYLTVAQVWQDLAYLGLWQAETISKMELLGPPATSHHIICTQSSSRWLELKCFLTALFGWAWVAFESVTEGQSFPYMLSIRPLQISLQCSFLVGLSCFEPVTKCQRSPLNAIFWLDLGCFPVAD